MVNEIVNPVEIIIKPNQLKTNQRLSVSFGMFARAFHKKSHASKFTRFSPFLGIFTFKCNEWIIHEHAYVATIVNKFCAV